MMAKGLVESDMTSAVAAAEAADRPKPERMSAGRLARLPATKERIETRGSPFPRQRMHADPVCFFRSLQSPACGNFRRDPVARRNGMTGNRVHIRYATLLNPSEQRHCQRRVS